MPTGNTWITPELKTAGGYHQIVMSRPGGTPVDVTFLRGVPAKLGPYASADPFGDTTCSIGFPQVSALDDLTTDELSWLREDTLVDIWWVPAMAVPAGWVVDPNDEYTALWENPLSGQADVIAPPFEYVQSGSTWTRTATRRGDKVYEGFIASVEDELDEKTSSLSASCQGALFETDLLLAKPFYPPRPQTVESLIAAMFSHKTNPSLRTRELQIEWPTGWTFTAPSFAGTSNVFTPNVKPGSKWTGYTTRQTGSWDHRLTSFIQNLLAVMLVKPGSGVTPGAQWTLRLAREGDPTYPTGRTPVLCVRDRYATSEISLWCGQRGVTHNLTRDGTQKANAIYGAGTDLAGTDWRNAVVASDGSRTDYAPLAAAVTVYPVAGNAQLDTTEFVRESYVQYGTGFNQPDAVLSAQQTLQRDKDPGYSGTITLKVDPPEMSMWTITAGQTLRYRGFKGSGEPGVRFHIAQAEHDVDAGTVTLTVDTRYRDLLTLNEALNRSRDALTPAKLLSLNRNTTVVEDIQAPWDYGKGSGMIPKSSLNFFRHMPVGTRFPYTSWTKKYPPRTHPGYYAMVRASDPDINKRWTAGRGIMLAEKGTIRRVELVCVDRYGNVVPIRFHFSLYYNNGIDYTFMPTNNGGKTHSPFITGAFQDIDPATGQPWASPGHQADKSLLYGWGNLEQPAGYSPGSYTAGDKPTGKLIDETAIPFDCSANNANYDQLAKAGGEQLSVISVYPMFYADYSEPVYFVGRMFREEPGT